MKSILLCWNEYLKDSRGDTKATSGRWMINEKTHDNMGVDGTGIHVSTLLEGNTIHVKA